MNKSPRSLKKSVLMASTALLLLVFVGLAAYRLISGRSLGLRSFVTNGVRLAVSPVSRALSIGKIAAASTGDYTNIVFLHQSVGRGLIEQGGLRDQLAGMGYSLWDHDYNRIGLRDPQGKYLLFSYGVPDDNTDPEGLAAIFSQPVYDRPRNTLSSLLQHEVIIVKTCYTGSEILSDADLERDKASFRQVRDTMVRYPEKLFILLTPPPMNPARTDAESAARARELSTWLQSDEFLAGAGNIYVFDLFSQLAENDQAAADYNTLRAEYREGRDNHPTIAGNQAVGPAIAAFVDETVKQFRQVASHP